MRLALDPDEPVPWHGIPWDAVGLWFRSRPPWFYVWMVLWTVSWTYLAWFLVCRRQGRRRQGRRRHRRRASPPPP